MNTIDDLKKRSWVFLGATAYPMYLEIFAKVASQEYRKMYGLPNDILTLFEGSNCDWFYDEKQLIQFAQKILPQYLEGSWSEYDKARDEAKKFVVVHEECMKSDISQLTHSELQNCARSYEESFFKQFKYNNFNESLSYYFQLHLKDLLKEEGVEEKDLDIVIDYYGRPKYSSYYKDCLHEYRFAHTQEEKNSVIHKYYYFAYSYAGPVQLTIEYLDKLTNQELPDEPKRPEINVSVNARKILDVFQMISTLQDVRKRESLLLVAGTEKFLIEFTKRRGVPKDLMMFALWSEMIEGTVSSDELTKRKDRCIILFTNEGTEVLWSGVEKNALDTLRNELKGFTPNTTEIKGVSASKGVVTGRAKVVLKLEEFVKVEKGDVLFTVMTRPEYLPIMYTASAFVTDEGGVASHAAIVAREMKKPCIIATKVGTQIVKDGDLVEVNADKGIVNILKKYHEA